ncbi:TetR/AcrR family transcriptional regulator [Rhodococcus sp. ARC_M6]|uniref:TetR/AcrR family transcriptional regulator n=1 Tax=Rhodococcus sp. ARC_M6 TaxID=2928852 RepID=UPI001FB2FF97|nr:TetR/AcrR family transcriptional regulator [Rhodococcus sp. ARC_M6]MCJ0905474.1 TetR/AcrR family transcriptional regulator [Rhodococcus sp. ARC_M6]
MTNEPATRGSWRQYEDLGLPKPLAAALEAFVEQGYHGASIRDIAARAGLSVPGLYHHYPSKQALLIGLTTVVMGELLERTGVAEMEAGSDPSDRFDAVIESLLRFHMFRREQSFVASSELRSMEPEGRAKYIAQRDAQQKQVDQIVLDGVESGVFAAEYPEDASRAVVTMCVAVAQWYRPDGELSPGELVERYLGIARCTVSAKQI